MSSLFIYLELTDLKGSPVYICDNRFMVFRARREDNGEECTYINGKQVAHTVQDVWDLITQTKQIKLKGINYVN